MRECPMLDIIQPRLFRGRREMEKLNGICYWLIQKCRETNAEIMTIGQDGVVHKGEKWGDWEITVRKVAPEQKQTNV